MAITEAFANSATIGTTEFSCPNNSTTLTPQTDDGVYQACFDTAAIALGDQFQFRVYEKVRSAGTQRVIYEQILTGAEATTLVFPTLILLHGWDVTMKKLAGTDRAVEWSIRKVA